MSEELIVRHCSPTLAGLKTGNMFSCDYRDRKELDREIRALNRRLTPKGLRVIPLRCGEKRALIYLYRPTRLKRDLAEERACAILSACGYPVKSTGYCLARLRARLAAEEEFPHEIGLFLGYPPEDVQGFMEKRTACAGCVGCWKVYGNEEQARKTFEKFRKCTSLYCALWSAGKSIERLTVAD